MSLFIIGALAAVGGYVLSDLWQVFSFWKWPDLEVVAANPILHVKRYIAIYELYAAVLLYLVINHPRLFGFGREPTESRYYNNSHDNDVQGILTTVFSAGWTFLHGKAFWIFCRSGAWRDPWVWPWMVARIVPAFISLFATSSFSFEFPRRVKSVWKYFRLRYWP